MSVLGMRIKQRRQAKGMTLRQLSEASGVTYGYICELETGKKSNPGVFTLRKIAVPLRTTVGVLIAGTPAGTTPQK